MDSEWEELSMPINLEPLLSASLAIQLHFIAVVPAFFLGTLQLFLPKGTSLHRITGYLFMLLMVLTAIAAFFIPSFMGGRFSFIHLFIPLTLITVPRGLTAARNGNVKAHRNAMIGLYVGALGIAGLLAFGPGRVMNEMFFG